MNTPPKYVLLALAKMLRDATHQNVAEHMAAGFLWAVYPEWFDRHYGSLKQGKLADDLVGGR